MSIFSSGSHQSDLSSGKEADLLATLLQGKTCIPNLPCASGWRLGSRFAAKAKKPDSAQDGN